jgi:hypothetical protein
MPIVISANADLALHVVEFTGRVRFSELTALAQTHAANRAWAGADTVHVVADDADLSLLTDDDLDVLRARYRELHQSIDFFMLRRSGWACATSEACRIVEHWLRDRHSRDGQGTEVYLASALDGLSELFSAEELQAVAARTGFVEQWKIDRTRAPGEDARHG